MLAVLGGALGIAVGAAILQVTPSVIPDGLLPNRSRSGVRHAGRCLLCSRGARARSAVRPRTGVAHTRIWLRPAQAMAGDTRTTTAHGGGIRALLVVGEVAAAVLLLVGAGLLLRTLLAVDNVPRGYRSGKRSHGVRRSARRTVSRRKESLLQFFDSVERETSADTNVRSMAWASTLPLGESTFGSVVV